MGVCVHAAGRVSTPSRFVSYARRAACCLASWTPKSQVTWTPWTARSRGTSLTACVWHGMWKPLVKMTSGQGRRHCWPQRFSATRRSHWCAWTCSWLALTRRPRLWSGSWLSLQCTQMCSDSCRCVAPTTRPSVHSLLADLMDDCWQDELDSVVPFGSRAPCLADLDQLPLLAAAVKETLRLKTVVPITRRTTTKDCTLRVRRTLWWGHLAA